MLEGDKLYKSFNIQNYRNVEELSREIVVFSHNVTLKVSEENLQERTVAQWEPFLRDIFVLSANIKTVVQNVYYSSIVMQLPYSDVLTMMVTFIIFCLIHIVETVVALEITNRLLYSN